MTLRTGEHPLHVHIKEPTTHSDAVTSQPVSRSLVQPTLYLGESKIRPDLSPRSPFEQTDDTYNYMLSWLAKKKGQNLPPGRQTPKKAHNNGFVGAGHFPRVMAK